MDGEIYGNIYIFFTDKVYLKLDEIFVMKDLNLFHRKVVWRIVFVSIFFQ